MQWTWGSVIKQINFLVGLPRAGNTLLGSIINQNTNFVVTANGITNEMCKEIEKLQRGDVFKNFPYQKPFDDVCYNILPNYYSNWKQNYILDRGPWGFPNNLKFLKKYHNQKLKFIVLVRDVYEVLQSFLKHGKENKNSLVNKSWAKTDEEKCDMLMDKKGLIIGELISIHHLTKIEENKHMAHVVEYNDLINDPEKTITNIYKFLNIPYFKHSFDKFDQFQIEGQMYDDTEVGQNLHKVKENGLHKNIHSPLPKSVINKYNNLNFWRNNE